MDFIDVYQRVIAMEELLQRSQRAAGKPKKSPIPKVRLDLDIPVLKPKKKTKKRNQRRKTTDILDPITSIRVNPKTLKFSRKRSTEKSVTILQPQPKPEPRAQPEVPRLEEPK